MDGLLSSQKPQPNVPDPLRTVNESILKRHTNAESIPYNLSFEELSENESLEVIQRMIPVISNLVFEYCVDFDGDFDPKDYVTNIKKSHKYTNPQIVEVFNYLNLDYKLKSKSSHFDSVIRKYYEYPEKFEFYKTFSNEDKKMILKDFEDFNTFRIHYKFPSEYLLIMRFKDFIIARLDDDFYINQRPL